MIYAVDFDGTIVKNEYPIIELENKIGDPTKKPNYLKDRFE